MRRFALQALLCGAAAPMMITSPGRAQFSIRQSSDSVPVVAASGSATVPLQADRAVVYASVAGRDSTSPGALASARVVRDRVTAALARVGIPAASVSPWGFVLSRADVAAGARMYVENGVAREQSPATRAGARWGVRVVVDDVGRLDAVLDALTRAGVESAPFVEFTSTHADQARTDATAQAVAEARRNADAMAHAAGGHLGPLLSMSNFPDYGVMQATESRFFLSPGFEAAGALTPSDVTLRVGVMGTWRFIPGR